MVRADNGIDDGSIEWLSVSETAFETAESNFTGENSSVDIGDRARSRKIQQHKPPIVSHPKAIECQRRGGAIFSRLLKAHSSDR